MAERTAVAVLILCLALPLGAEELLNRVVLRVNDRIATLHDYRERLESLQADLSRAENVPLAVRRQRIAELPEQVYANLLQELLFLSRADQLGIVFTEEEVDQQVQRVRQRYGMESDEEFRQAMAQSGMSEREFREQIRTSMRINELLAREVRQQIDVDEELARIYYRDHPEQFMTPQRMRLRELVVLDDSGLSEEQRLEVARSIRAELLEGRALDEVADAVAEELGDDGATSDVIDVGWVTAGDLAEELQQAVWDLQPEEVSEPVASRGGLHVVQVAERQDEGLLPFNDVADQALQRAGEEIYQEKMQEYMAELERQSYVVFDPPPGAEDFRSATGQPPAELAAAPPDDEGAAAEPSEAEAEDLVPDVGATDAPVDEDAGPGDGD